MSEKNISLTIGSLVGLSKKETPHKIGICIGKCLYTCAVK